LKKTRYNVTPFYFIISDITGKSITTAATDGSVKTIKKLRVIPMKSNELNSLNKQRQYQEHHKDQ
jgi:hypothetical protein